MSRKTLQFAVGGMLIVATATVSLGWVHLALGMAAGLGAMTALLVAVAHHWKQVVTERIDALNSENNELRAHQTLSVIPFKAPLPWSSPTLSPITISQVLFEVRARKAQNVVECGCGISTVYLAWILRHLGVGKVYSIEQEEPWAVLIQEILDENGLSDFVQIVRAPLAKGTFGSREGIWYDTSALSELFELPAIDLLLVDGPQQKLGPFARCWLFT